MLLSLSGWTIFLIKMTDSVNSDNAEAQNTASQPLFSLADVDTLYELFEVVLYDVLRRSVAVSEGKLSKDEAAAMDKQSAAFVSAVLAGKNEQFAPKPFWTGDPLAGYLRLFMKERFESVGLTDEDLKDTRGVLQAASFEFICDVYAMIRVMGDKAEPEAFKQMGKRLCRMWAERMLGRKETDPVSF